MKSFLYNNALSLTLVLLFVVCIGFQGFFGWRAQADDNQQHGQPPVAFVDYLTSGHFHEAVFENWESEFLQMAAFLLLTRWLRQRGSSESRKLKSMQHEEKAQHEEIEEKARRQHQVPGPVRRGGVWLKLYENSLLIVFTLLFVVSWLLHATAGMQEFNHERAQHGEPLVSLWGYAGNPRFWYESLQNWQSEFLALLSIVVLSIWLRDKESPQSKPVGAAHRHTGH